MQITDILHWLQGLKINIIQTILLEILSKIKYQSNDLRGFRDGKVQRLKYKPENSLSLFIATATPIIPVGDFSNFFGRLVFLERKERKAVLFPSIALLLHELRIEK